MTCGVWIRQPRLLRSEFAWCVSSRWWGASIIPIASRSAWSASADAGPATAPDSLALLNRARQQAARMYFPPLAEATTSDVAAAGHSRKLERLTDIRVNGLALALSLQHDLAPHLGSHLDQKAA